KKRRARLVHGDRLTLGDAELQFAIFDEPTRSPSVHDATLASAGTAPSEVTKSASAYGASSTLQQIAGVRKLYEFSEKLMTLKNIDELLEAMLDAVIDVTGAEKGLILLMEEGSGDASTPGTPSKPVIRASRAVKREAIADTTGTISDSIVRR